MKLFALAVGMAVAVCLASVAQAATVTYSGSAGEQQTDWNTLVPVTKFSPSFGILTSIQINLTGYVDGNSAEENLSNDPAGSVTAKLQATVKLQRPDLSNIVITLPLSTFTDTLGAWDGVSDYLGPDSAVHYGQHAADTETSFLVAPADLALFTGAGSLNLPFNALGASTVVGGGNLQSKFDTYAGADWQVEYTYTVPEPVTMVLLSVGAAGMILRRQHR